MGIKNEYFGDVIFAFMIFVVISCIAKPKKSKKMIIKLGILFGALTALYFIYLQFFVVHAICKYCMVIDSSMILALLVNSIPSGNKQNLNSEKIKISVEDK